MSIKVRAASNIAGRLGHEMAGQLRIMTGTAVGEAETCKDSIDASGGRQWTDPHGFHFLEYGIGPVGSAPVI